jgi:hypothetical protein
MARTVVADENEITLRELIAGGDVDGMRTFLKETGSSVIFQLHHWEPYAAIQKDTQVETLRLLLDDTRFLFDDLFTARALYFSTPQLNRAILRHPRIAQLALGYQKSFMEYFDKRFRYGAPGMDQRYIHAINKIACIRKILLNKKLAFALYPALVRYTRDFKQRYYTPGTGAGYLKVKAEFDRLAKT